MISFLIFPNPLIYLEIITKQLCQKSELQLSVKFKGVALIEGYPQKHGK